MRTLLTLVLALGLGLPGSALAQDDPWDSQDPEARAKELYQNGAILYEEGRYEDAVVAWDEAYRLSQRPALLYNIANAQERLGLWQEALDTLNRYRAYAGAGQRDSLDRRIANLERRLTDTGGSGTPVETEPEVVEPMISKPPTGRQSSSSNLDLLPVGLMGGGAVLLGVGGVFALSAGGARRSAATGCTETDSGTWCLESVSSDLRRDRTSSVVADVSFLLGAAGLATGGALMLMDTGGGLRVGPTPGGLVLTGRLP